LTEGLRGRGSRRLPAAGAPSSRLPRPRTAGKQRVAGDERPAELEQKEPELMFSGRENSQDAGADEIEGEVPRRMGREPSALRPGKRHENEHRPEHLDDLVQREPPCRAVVRPGTARTLVRTAAKRPQIQSSKPAHERRSAASRICGRPRAGRPQDPGRRPHELPLGPSDRRRVIADRQSRLPRAVASGDSMPCRSSTST
jgi:hypothetical protein